MSLKLLECEGWTAFLKSFTPTSIFDGLDSENPKKRRVWEKLLNDMYKVAGMEEDHLNGARGTWYRAACHTKVSGTAR